MESERTFVWDGSKFPPYTKPKGKTKKGKTNKEPKKGVIFPSAATETLVGVTIYKLKLYPSRRQHATKSSPNHIGTTFIKNITATFQVSRAIFLRSCTWIVDHAQEVIFDGTNAENFCSIYSCPY